MNPKMSFHRYTIVFSIEDVDEGPVMELVEYVAPGEDYRDATERIIRRIREEF